MGEVGERRGERMSVGRAIPGVMGGEKNGSHVWSYGERGSVEDMLESRLTEDRNTYMHACTS